MNRQYVLVWCLLAALANVTCGQDPKVLIVGGVPVGDLERSFGCTPGDDEAGVDNADRMNAALARAGAPTDGIFDPYYLPGKPFAVSRTLYLPARSGIKLSCNGAAHLSIPESQAGGQQGPASRLIWTGPTNTITFDGSSVTASADGISDTITLTGRTVLESDVGYVLHITSGAGGFVDQDDPEDANPNDGLYVVRDVDTTANTWTLHRACTATSGSHTGMIGAATNPVVTFDGTAVTASGEGNTITLDGYAVTDSDVGMLLRITGGNGFKFDNDPDSGDDPNYRVASVDPLANSWTLNKICTNGQASGMTGTASHALLASPANGLEINGVLNLIGNWRAVSSNSYYPRGAVGFRPTKNPNSVPSGKSANLQMAIFNFETGVEVTHDGDGNHADNLHWNWLRLASCNRGYWLRDNNQAHEHVFDYLLVHTDSVRPHRMDPIFEIGSLDKYGNGVLGGDMIDVKFMQVNGPSTVFKHNASGGNGDRFVIHNCRFDSSAFPQVDSDPTTAGRYTRFIEMTRADFPHFRLAGHLPNDADKQRQPPAILWGNGYDVECQFTNMPAYWQDALWDTKLGMPARAAAYEFPQSGLVRHFKFFDEGYSVDSGIATLVDHSPSGLDLTQATSGNQPLYREDLIHRRPAGDFIVTGARYMDGSNAGLVNVQEMTVFVVFRPSTMPGDRVLMSADRINPNQSRGWRLIMRDDDGAARYELSALFSDSSQSNFQQAQSGASLNRRDKLCIGIAEFDGRTYTSGGTGLVGVQLDNEQRDVFRFNPGAGYTINNSAAPFRLGGWSQDTTDTISNDWNGYIAEVLIYNRQLTADERNEIGEKLFARWGAPYLKVAGITGATAATPIAITSANHGLSTGKQITITGVGGVYAANGKWTVTKVDDNTFSLNGSSGSGTYVGGTGNWSMAQ